jgi:hypothetical protein
MHLIMMPQLKGGWRHNYSTKTRLSGCASEQLIYSLVLVFSGKEKISQSKLKKFLEVNTFG